MRAIQKVTSIYFRQLMLERGRARVYEVVSRDSLPCKPLHNWSPSVSSCLYWVTCPATDNPASHEIQAIIHCFHAKNMSAVEIHNELIMGGLWPKYNE
jgi:hypothetical protein